jgi:hypothetical protein
MPIAGLCNSPTSAVSCHGSRAGTALQQVSYHHARNGGIRYTGVVSLRPGLPTGRAPQFSLRFLPALIFHTAGGDLTTEMAAPNEAQVMLSLQVMYISGLLTSGAYGQPISNSITTDKRS